MAETRTINLEIKDNFKKVEKDIDDLNKSLKDTGKEFDKAATFAERYGDELQPLTTRMGEAEDRLYELAAAGQTTTQEYKELLETVGQYRQVQIQTDLAVDGASQTMTQKLGSALNGATSAFSTTQGAMALFGSENEALEESLLKVQAALAIQQGVDGLTTSYKELGGKTGIATKAQAVFNFVMNLNPILLIVSGITLAIAALLKFTSVLDPVIDGLKNFGDAIGLTDFAAEEKEKNDKKRDAETIARANKRLTEIDKEIAAREKLRKNIDYAYSVQDKAAQRQIELLKAQGKDTTNLEKARLKAALSYQTQLQTETYLLIQQNKEKSLLTANELYAIGVRTKDFAEYNKFMREFKAKQGELLKTNLEATESKKDLVKQLAILDIEEKKGSVNRNKDFANKQRELARQIQDEEIKGIKDLNQREQTQLIVSAQRRIEDLSLTAKDKKKNAKLILEIQNNLNKDLEKLDEKFYEAQRKAQEEAQKLANSNKIRLQREFDNIIEALAEQNFQNTLTEEQREIQAVNDKYFELQTLAAGNAEQLAIIEQAKADELGAIEKKANEKSVEEARAVAEQKAAIQQQGLDTALQGVQLIKGLFEKSKGVQKAAVIAESAIGIAKMIISNKLANAGALATPQAIATSGAAAAPVIALNNISTGIGIAANIAATAKALKSLGGGSAPSAPADGGGGGGGGGASTTPQFNTIGSSGVNQLAQLQQQPVQAYVVSGDVTSAQSLDRNRIQNATL
jgi:hypothetical protein